MGNIELRGKTRKRKRDFKYAFLTALKLSALAGVVVTAPALPAALAKLGIIPDAPQSSHTIARARREMIKKGLLTETQGKLRATHKGAARLRLLEAQYAIQHPKRWDGRWRILVFDIPEYRKSTRNKIRTTLRSVGFLRLQDSVWVYPHDCEDLVALLKADMKIGKDVLYMIVDELEGDASLRKEFGLRSAR